MKKMNSALRAVEVQHLLFERIRQQLPKGTTLATLLADTLNVSTSNIYGRIRGEIRLSLQEIVVLSQTFNLSMDELIGLSSGQGMICERPPFIRSLDSLAEYLDQTYKKLSSLTKLEHQLYYAARDLPLFLYFQSDDLAAFKLYVWMNGVNPDFKRNHHPRNIPLELIAAARELGALYGKLNTIELWTDRTIINQLKQLEYHYSTGFLSREDVKKVLLALKEHLLITERQAGLEKKSGGGGLKLYASDYLMMANNALLQTEVLQVAFLSYAGINYVECTDKAFATDLEHWFKAQITAAQSLGDAHEKDRLVFFNRMYHAIQAFNQSLDQL